MGKVTIMPWTTKEPITMIGICAAVCVGADTSDAAKNYQRGWDCITSGHGRTMEFPDVYMTLEGYSARVMREWYTHIGCLPTRLQASTRYIDYGEFEYIVPKSIKDNPVALKEYECCMCNIRDVAQFLEYECKIPREDVANLFPLGMKSVMIDKRNLRNLIDMSHSRKCTRAMWEFREMFTDVENALIEYGADSGEWETIVRTQFVPKCELTGYCNEKKGCGRKPKK